MLPDNLAFETEKDLQSLFPRNDSANFCQPFIRPVLLLLLSVFSIVVVASYCTGQELTVVNISTEQFDEVMQTYPDMAVVDIRTPGEFNQHHIQDAKNIDFSAPDFKARLNLLDKDDPILIHCRSGNRSGQSLVVFEELGFEKVFHLYMGINGGWPARQVSSN